MLFRSLLTWEAHTDRSVGFGDGGYILTHGKTSCAFTIRFLQAVGIYDRCSEPIETLEVPFVSCEAQSLFYEIITRERIPEAYQVGWKRLKADSVKRTIEALEQFSATFALRERYLPAYARLYALVLRNRFGIRLENLEHEFKMFELEHQYRSELACMAGWWRAILLAYADAPTALEAFQSVAETYSGIDLWIVEAAKQAGQSKANWQALHLFDK